jgi:hypothetical protein
VSADAEGVSVAGKPDVEDVAALLGVYGFGVVGVGVLA